MLAGLFSAVVETMVVYLAVKLSVAGGVDAHRLASGALASIYAASATAAVGVMISQLILLVLRGGMMKMVIDSARSGAPMDFTSLFSGFSRFLSYIGLWGITSIAVPLGLFAVLAVTTLFLGPFALLVGLGAAAFMVWLVVCWVYGLPLIADLGLNPIAALDRSRDMVRRNGWWPTFAALFALGFVMWLIALVIAVAQYGSGIKSYTSIGVSEILMVPFVICFVASMYMGGQWPAATTAHGSWPAGPGFSDPPASISDPPASIYGSPAGSYGPPAGAYGPPAGAYGPPPGAPMAPGPYTAAPPAYEQPYGPPAPLDPAREADAWAAAADPLAGSPPPAASPPHDPD